MIYRKKLSNENRLLNKGKINFDFGKVVSNKNTTLHKLEAIENIIHISSINRRPQKYANARAVILSGIYRITRTSPLPLEK